jgi:two-component system, cell cycle sensor histidine kinase and response regulator CckA
MSEDVLARLFEPFFTTKEAGRGTGLGLANVYACVKNHHGAIAVGSTLGQGTIFRLWLPLAAAGAEQAPSTTIEGSGRILIVDDDPDLRAMATEILTALGYATEVAADGVEAVARYTAGKFDLVLLDMVMPGLDGRETIIRLRATEPTARILLCSGSVEDEAAAKAFGADGFIRKPYQIATLSQRIAGLIRRPGG